jgi:actin-related protein 6
VYQLTGIRVSDPHLSSSETLGDLYDHLYAAAKPQPKSLLQAIKSEGNEARRRANIQARAGKPARRRADLGDLINLGNVELRTRPFTKKEVRIKTGLNKVVTRALAERGLRKNALDVDTRKSLENRVGVVEGTRKVPEFGKVLSSRGAAYLEEETRKRKQREEDAQRATL